MKVCLGAVAMIAAALAAVWVSGLIEAFGRDRGLLQFVVAIPAASLLTAGALAYSGVLDRAQMLGAMAPVAILIILGVGALGPGWAAWPWALGIGGALFLPWTAGALIGSVLGGSSPAGAGGTPSPGASDR